MIRPRTLTGVERYSPLVKRLHLARAYFTRRPIWCAWQVTYRCNFKCDFCDYWRTRPSRDELTVAEFARGARNLAKSGSLLVSLAGGEPMMRRDIVDVVREVSRFHLTFLTTNGWLVTRENARAVYEAGLWGVSVSIDYADADRHDERRGVKGAFERAVRALRYFSEERIGRHQRINLQAVLLDDNLGDMAKLAALARKYDANFMIQPYCALKTGESAHACREPASEELLRVKSRFPNFLSNPVFLAQFDDALNGGVPGCMCGRAFFNIDQFGEVAKCVEDRVHPVGSIVTDDINTLLKRLRDKHRTNTCMACWYNCRGEIEAVYGLRGLLHSLPTYLYGLAGRNRPK